MRMLILCPLLCLLGCGQPGVDDAIDAVRGEVIESPSARFRDVVPCPSGKGYYGMVNSKNVKREYMGYQPFIYAEGNAALYESQMEYQQLRLLCAVKKT